MRVIVGVGVVCAMVAAAAACAGTEEPAKSPSEQLAESASRPEVSAEPIPVPVDGPDDGSDVPIAYRQNVIAKRARLKERRAVDQQRESDRLAARKSEEDARAAAHEADCAKDRAERHAAVLDAYREQRARLDRRAKLEAYAEKNCKRVTIKDYARVACDDGSGIVKVCNEYRGEHEELKCPKGAPAELADGHLPVKPGVEMPIRDYRRNEFCKDVPSAEEMTAAAAKSP